MVIAAVEAEAAMKPAAGQDQAVAGHGALFGRQGTTIDGSAKNCARCVTCDDGEAAASVPRLSGSAARASPPGGTRIRRFEQDSAPAQIGLDPDRQQQPSIGELREPRPVLYWQARCRANAVC